MKEDFYSCSRILSDTQRSPALRRELPRCGDDLMEWQFDKEKNAWNLYDSQSVVARIYIKEKPDQKSRFLTKTLISSIYFGARTFSRLTRSNKEWKAQNRKFATREEMDSYIENKKKVVLKFVEQI